MGTARILAYGVVCGLFAVATYGRFKINERKFERRNIAGLEQFESYGQAVRTKIGEGVISFVAGVCQLVTLIVWLCLITGTW